MAPPRSGADPPSGAASSYPPGVAARRAGSPLGDLPANGPCEIRQRSYGERAGSRCICNLSGPTVWPLILHQGGWPRNGVARWTSRSSAMRRPTDLAVAPASSPDAPARTRGSCPIDAPLSSRRGQRATARRPIGRSSPTRRGDLHGPLPRLNHQPERFNPREPVTTRDDGRSPQLAPAVSSFPAP
jgi:hypothetical protein